MKDEFYVIKNADGVITNVVHNGVGDKYTVEHEDTKDKYSYSLTVNDYDNSIRKIIVVDKCLSDGIEHTSVNRDEWLGSDVYDVYIPESKFNMVYAIKKLKELFMEHNSDLYKEDFIIKYRCDIPKEV